MRNVHVATAVAVALGTAAAVHAAPTPSAAMSAAHNVYMAGSSAAVNGVVAFLENTVCGGAFSVFTTPTTTPGLPDFRAVNCSPATGQPFAGSTLTVWYRPEGGSVVGVFPVINNGNVRQLNMTAASCVTTAASSAASASYNCTGVQGTTPGNGTDDSFGTGTFAHNVDIGISDLEPGVFANTGIGTTKSWAGAGNNDPVGTYAASFTGNDQGVSSVQNVANLPHAAVFQQVFGFIVNTNLGITSLPKEQIAGIFDALVTDWSQVATGATSSATVTSTSTPIVICNREVGSGTRGSADIFLNGDGCNGVGSVSPLTDVAGITFGTLTEPNDNFQTAAELDCVNRNPNSIGYVSIDNFSKLQGTTVAPNANSIAVSGVVASQLNAATGVYSYVYEATANFNKSGASSDGSTFYTDLVPILQAVNTTAKSGQILAIPNQAGNTAQLPLQQGSPSTEFTSLFTRGGGTGNSCTPLTPQL
jgi:hypothetical protein